MTNQLQSPTLIKRGPLEFTYADDLYLGGELVRTFKLIDLDPAHASLMHDLFGEFWARAPECTIQWRLARMLREKRRRAYPRLADAASGTRPLSAATQATLLEHWGKETKTGLAPTAKSRAREAALAKSICEFATDLLSGHPDRRRRTQEAHSHYLANRFPQAADEDTARLLGIFRAEIADICGPPDVFAFTRGGAVPPLLFEPTFCPAL